MVYYLGYYSCEQIAAENRIAPPPGMNKMGYVISVLSKISEEHSLVVSPSETRLNRYIKGKKTDLNDHMSIRTFDSFHSGNRPIRILGHIVTKAQLAFFLLTHLKKDDTLIVYHSLSLMRIVKLVKMIKNCRLIIEAEELYSDVYENKKKRKKELAYLQIADSYIVVTKSLDDEINIQKKPSIIVHGTYQTVSPYGEKIHDGKTHVVYAGSFSMVKGGALSAIEAAEFLDESYVMHILGRGSLIETKMVTEKIEEVSVKTRCKMVFDGYKTGTEFDEFIQSCHIGLSTRQSGEKYNASSFPSKVLMYMSNDLPVVSIRVPAIENSKVGEYIYYYDSPTPQNIAQAIRSVPTDGCLNVRERLDALDEAFKEELSDLLMQ